MRCWRAGPIKRIIPLLSGDNMDFVVKGRARRHIQGGMLSRFHLQPIVSIVNGVGANRPWRSATRTGSPRLPPIIPGIRRGSRLLSPTGALANGESGAKLRRPFPPDYQVIHMHARWPRTQAGTVALFLRRPVEIPANVTDTARGPRLRSKENVDELQFPPSVSASLPRWK
jgi:hypothetical protein